MRLLRPAAMCLIGTLIACRSSLPASKSLTAAERARIADTVRALVHEYVTVGNSPTLCSDPSPLFKFDGYIDGALIYASGTTVATMTQSEVETLTTKNVCSRRSMNASVSNVTVQVLSRDVAVAAWTFDETKTDSAGVAERVKGSVLHSWLRTADGWKATAWMDAHVVVPK